MYDIISLKVVMEVLNKGFKNFLSTFMTYDRMDRIVGC